ncbi:hypothetical protein NDU88_006958 [Pleurodeles waltl]|uniref:Uncharacterized protein n=1 Tax=Pleurodeles waltl TaxID=8319 RepID=A0AAV7SR41_PLEWA|nr:hypothetical protein NDU88_006958 [Pleurodeles waltl]
MGLDWRSVRPGPEGGPVRHVRPAGGLEVRPDGRWRGLSCAVARFRLVSVPEAQRKTLEGWGAVAGRVQEEVACGLVVAVGGPGRRCWVPPRWHLHPTPCCVILSLARPGGPRAGFGARHGRGELAIPGTPVGGLDPGGPEVAIEVNCMGA